jgi:hypothetical protein
MQKNWCDSCRKHILPIKIFNRRAFFILLLITFIGGIIYLIYYMFSSGDTCPICKQNKFLRFRKPREIYPKYAPEQAIPQTDSQLGTALKFCPYCGSRLSPSGDYCSQCGIKI